VLLLRWTDRCLHACLRGRQRQKQKGAMASPSLSPPTPSKQTKAAPCRRSVAPHWTGESNPPAVSDSGRTTHRILLLASAPSEGCMHAPSLPVHTLSLYTSTVHLLLARTNNKHSGDLVNVRIGLPALACHAWPRRPASLFSPPSQSATLDCTGVVLCPICLSLHACLPARSVPAENTDGVSTLQTLYLLL
jgi:hypothetical protein